MIDLKRWIVVVDEYAVNNCINGCTRPRILRDLEGELFTALP